MQSSLNSKADFSGNLRRARQRAGLDQKGLAELLGTDQSTISRVESGQQPRKQLQTAILDFIEKQSTKERSMTSKVLNQLQNSNEFHALINRIVDEL